MGSRRGLALPLLSFFLSYVSVSLAGDSINRTQAIKDDGRAMLLSSSGRFVFGFFSPGSSRNRYLGIWYSFASGTVVWVANRQDPVPDSSGILNITDNGSVSLYQTSSGRLVWSTSPAAVGDVLLRLLDSGNLVVVDTGSGEPLWQSFDNPTDTLLPLQKMGIDFRTGRNLSLTSWRSTDDPSPGDYVCGINSAGLHEIQVRSTAIKGGGSIQTGIKFRLGHWNGIWFGGNPRMLTYGVNYKFMYVSNTTEVGYTYDVTSSNIVSRVVLHPEGIWERLAWNYHSTEWTSYWKGPLDECDTYAKCGPNGVCNSETLGLCQCYTGFQPRSRSSWDVKDFQAGCRRNEALNCSAAASEGLGFLLVQQVKLPDTSYATRNASATLDDCREACLRNCSCTAFAADDISTAPPRACIMWFGDLMDTRTFSDHGQDIYLKLPASEVEKLQKNGRKSASIIIVMFISIGVVATIVLCIARLWIKCKNVSTTSKGSSMREVTIYDREILPSFVEVDLYGFATTSLAKEVIVYDFEKISSATENFSKGNIIGEGGFSIVYKIKERDPV